YSGCRCLIGRTRLCLTTRSKKPPPALDKSYDPGTCGKVEVPDLIYHSNCPQNPALLCNRGSHIPP
ncbi:hypothetical protein B0T20DRAFT_327688, partial [Sordaria brevicollis]